MPYMIECGNNEDDLADKVNFHLTKGFELYGNPFIAMGSGSAVFYQAVIKKDEIKSDI